MFGHVSSRKRRGRFGELVFVCFLFVDISETAVEQPFRQCKIDPLKSSRSSLGSGFLTTWRRLCEVGYFHFPSGRFHECYPKDALPMH